MDEFAMWQLAPPWARLMLDRPTAASWKRLIWMIQFQSSMLASISKADRAEAMRRTCWYWYALFIDLHEQVSDLQVRGWWKIFFFQQRNDGPRNWEAPAFLLPWNLDTGWHFQTLCWFLFVCGFFSRDSFKSSRRWGLFIQALVWWHPDSGADATRIIVHSQWWQPDFDCGTN